MNKKLLILILLFLVSGLLLAACASGSTGPEISGTDWKLISYGPVGSQVQAAEGIDTSLKFGSDGRVSGNMGCNSFGGEYTQKDGQVTFGPLASTVMACQEPQMSQEGTAFAILTGSVDFTIDGDVLTILDASSSNALILTRQ